MRKSFQKFKKLIPYVIIPFIFTEIFMNISAFITIHNKSSLLDKIYTYDSRIKAKVYETPRWSESNIQTALSYIKDPKESSIVERKMREEKSTRRFFYLNQDYTEIFISAENAGLPNGYCRVFAKNSSISIKLINLIGLDSSYNGVSHEVDQNLCNSLYGYGSSKVIK